MMTPELFYASLLLLAGTYKNNELHFKNLQTPGYTLIACSARQKTDFEHDFVRTLWKAKHLDLSYSNNPETITLDKKEAVNKGQHIIADLDKKTIIMQNVKRIYLERPETVNRTVQGIQNNVGIYVHNLLPSLPNDGELTIEWHPFLALSFGFPADMSPQEVEANLAQRNKQNPFTGYFNGDYCLAITKKTLHQTEECKPSTKNDALCQKVINQLLDFYAANQSASREALSKRLEREIQIMEYKKNMHSCPIFTPQSTKESVQTFNDMANNILITVPTPQGNLPLCIDLATNKQITIPKDTLKTYKEFVLDNTLFNYLWSDVAVLMNGKLAIECLQKLGLKNVQLWRGTSPYNGRKNVWLLRGYKASREDKILAEADAELRALLHTSSYKQ